MELQSQYWRTSSLPNLIPPTAAEFTPELVENHALNFDLHLADTKLKVNLPTLMSVSPIFRTMIDWESQPGQAFPTNKDGLPVVFLSLPEDNLGKYSFILSSKASKKSVELPLFRPTVSLHPQNTRTVTFVLP